MNTATETPDWREQLKKQASPIQEAPRDDIAEAFAQQAYTALENRMAPLMVDPHLLGFEIVDRNEQNNRLVGALAARSGNELILAPVFFLNGTIKGQCLLYRKTKDQFVPNNKTQVRAIMAEANSGEQGVQVDPRTARQATMEFDTRALAAPSYKRATEIDEATRQEIRELWKSACACAAAHADVPTRKLFADFVVNNGFQKEAAEMAGKEQEFAEAILVSGALREEVHVKEAAAVPPPLRLITSFPEDPDLLKSASGNLFKRGYSIEDNRPQGKLLEAFEEGGTEEYLRTSPHEVIDWALNNAGKPVKVLTAAVGGRAGRGLQSHHPDSPGVRPDAVAVGLEGDQKGRFKVMSDGARAVYTDNKPVFDEATLMEELMKIGDDKPSKGKRYLIFSASRRKFVSPYPSEVERVEKDGPVSIVTIRYGGKYILRNDLEETMDEDLDRRYGGPTPVFGKDVRWIKVKEFGGKNRKDEPVVSGEEESLDLMDPERLWDRVINDHSRARVTAMKSAGALTLRANNRTATYGSPAAAAMKLASLGLSVPDALEIVDRMEAGERVAFRIIPPLEKLAHVWYQREPDYEQDFLPTGYDTDLQIPIDDISGVPIFYPTHRESRTRDAANYRDAAQPKGYSPDQHLDDEDLLTMSDPARQLSEIAATSGMDHLIDHGALAALVKTFDAVSLATSYLDDLEKGVDRLGRIVFLILWKPMDFAERFGEDDLPNLENTLVAAFEKHGDLVLDLRQRSSED